jgi:ribosome-associated protein
VLLPPPRRQAPRRQAHDVGAELRQNQRLRPCDSRTVQTIDFELRTDFIPLDDLLKATGLAPSGGAAKLLISEGQVRVDGEVELRKACKVHAGQIVSMQGARIRMHAPTRPAPLI